MADQVTLAIVGLDGASPNIYREFLDDLPTLHRVLNDGAGGTLQSTVPPITGPAWTTMMTGKGPGKHGVFDMTTPRGDYEIEPLQANRDQPMLFDHFDDSLFLNVPGSYPREPSGGATLVHSFDCPTTTDAIPESLADLPGADEYLLSNPKEQYSDEVSYIGRLREIESRRFQFLKESMNRLGNLDVTFTLFSSTDWALHFLSEADGDGWAEFRELYADIDDYVEWIEGHAENLLVLSDHGFERKRTRVNLARFLHAEGHLAFQNSSDRDQSVRDRALGTVTRSVSFLSSRSQTVRKVVQLIIDKVLSDEFVGEARDSWNVETDWVKTDAFPVGYQGIYLNDDRFDHGSTDRLNGVRDAIASKLRDLTDRDGSPVFGDVVTRESIYEGAYVADAPDLICLPNPHVSCHSTLNANDTVVNEVGFFDHRPSGIFSAVGPLFAGSESVTADIADVAPTILHLLDRPVPRAMDGEVIDRAISGDPNVTYTDQEPVAGDYNSVASDSDEVKERLGDLGYI